MTHPWKSTATWAMPPFLAFCVGYFEDRISPTIGPGWLQTMILLVRAFLKRCSCPVLPVF
jgi:hypothetical protein